MPASPQNLPSGSPSDANCVPMRALSPSARQSLLLVKPGSMGDVIHSLPVVAALHAARPASSLTWVVDPRWAPLLEENPGVSRIVHFPREDFRGLRGSFRALSWYLSLRGLRPDEALDLQGLLRSAVMARLSGARRIVGLDDAREGAGFFYSASVPTEPGEHSVLRYLRALSSFGVPAPDSPEFPLPRGNPPALSQPDILLHPFARGKAKSLDASAIHAFSDEMGRLPHAPQIAIVGSGDCPAGLPKNTLNLCRKTSLADLIGLTRAARFVVSVDSGPMHLAAALRRPLLGIHTWSDPRLVGPFSPEAWIWQGGRITRQDFSRAPLPEQPVTPQAAREIARFAAAQL